MDTQPETSTEPEVGNIAAPEVTSEPSVAPEAEKPHVSEFTPDYTYTFKGEKREIDEFFRGLIKDPESQQKVRDMVERAEALELHKSKSKEFEGRISEWEPKVKQLELYQRTFESAKTPAEHLSLLNEIGYNTEMLKDVVREVLTREQMPEDQKRYFEAAQRAELEKREALTHTEAIKHEFTAMLANVTEQQMGLELGKAENSNLVQAYESANGEGSFRQLFLERGAYLTQVAGRHVPPAEVMANLSKEFGWAVASRQVTGVTNAPQAIKPKQKSIPSVGTQSGSPTKPAISSLDDLQAKYKQLTGQV
jgi:hypothetical protein